ncbi:MAG: 8-amino-7-oxononanoate synthase [Myxococcota bacterium]
MPLDEELRRRLAALERAHRRRHLRPMAHGSYVELGGRRLLNLSSNDYLGFAAQPPDPAPTLSPGVGASRLITGSDPEHARAEAALAAYVGCAACRLFSSGYAANVGTIPALVGRGDVVFSDALNHASLIDGCRLSRAAIVRVPHGDLGALEAALRTHRPAAGHALVVTDALFSMDGDAADLVAIAHLARRYDAWWMVDEAHSLGLLGPEGRGLAYDLPPELQPDVRIGTLGKSFGLHGAFVAGSEALADWLTQRARSFVFSTGVSRALAAALPLRTERVRGAEEARRQALALARRLAHGLSEQGWRVDPPAGAIVPLHVGGDDEVLALGARLEQAGVLAQPIRPPTVPPGTARIRLTCTGAHTPADIDHALRAFASLRDPRLPATPRVEAP